VLVSRAGLVTIVGGKWTTYRRMAQDAVDMAIQVGGLEERPCCTEQLQIHGWLDREDPRLPPTDPMRLYGADAAAVEALIERDSQLGEPLHERLPYIGAQVIYAARFEMARTVEDVLARRTRALLLDARAALAAAPLVATLMAAALGRDAAWQQRQVVEFEELAQGYLVQS
jgi:glycerol-3-phosphate dehydrogenase